MEFNSTPFGDGRGLVGGRGDLRVKVEGRRQPFVHPMVYLPYDHPEQLPDARALFAHQTSEVEIGFGRGHFFKDRIRQAPEHRFLGFEVRRMWVIRMARFLEREGVANARVILEDARPVLSAIFAAGSVHAFYVFFPDPWWKKRHHKRRVMTPPTLSLLHHLLEPGGRLHFRTDVAEYFGIVHQLLADHAGFTRVDADRDAAGRDLPLTHREKKCAEMGIEVQRLCVVKSP